jgi:alkanesulfonate monooxygenase SsuD/methylene tetrahydromethanopterin reductase-like flavin-dependent oxidoreductase (luciferase family)
MQARDEVDSNVVRCGLHSGQQYASFPEILTLWQRAEQLGYDWVSLFDHLRPPIDGPAGLCLDGPTLLAALAARTSRVRCALLVSPVTWRHPALLAAAASTIDHVSGGRLELGLGAGSADLAYQQYHLPFPAPGQRVAMLEEACQVLRQLWTGGPVSFQGRYFSLTDAYLAPLPIQSRLPLIVGGERPQLLQVVAAHADVWNTLAGDPASYQAKSAVLYEQCRRLGRDPAEIRRSVTFRAVLDVSAHRARDRAERLLSAHPPNWPDRSEYLVFGTPEQCVEQLRPYLGLGVRDFLLGARPPLDWQTIELFATEVAPTLRSALQPTG